MKRTIPLSVALLLVALSLPADVLKIVVDDMIHPISDEFIGRALIEADQHHDRAVLVELRTPGGLETSMRSIVRKIIDSPVPVIVYVAPAGSRAASAGFFILEAADIAAMAPGTNTGAAHPVTLGGEKLDDAMKQKMENDAAALMRTVAGKRGRNVAIAESAVRQSKSFTEQEALSGHLIDIVAPNESALLRSIDGRPLKRFNGDSSILHLAGQRVRVYDMSLKERILSHLMDPNVAFILLALGALSLWAEFNHPGAVLPGAVGLISIVLAFLALNLMPVRFAAMALLIVALALFALEAKFAAHGVLAIGGIIAMIIGALFLVDGPIPEMQIHLLTAATVAIPFALIAVFLASLALRARRNRVVTGPEGMVGEVGIARTPLSPEGKVFVHGELWSARASGALDSGTRVRVKAVEGLRIIVEAAERQP
jgi:membrane-bound serine protease (ClpP class)